MPYEYKLYGILVHLELDSNVKYEKFWWLSCTHDNHSNEVPDEVVNIENAYQIKVKKWNIHLNVQPFSLTASQGG